MTILQAAAVVIGIILTTLGIILALGVGWGAFWLGLLLLAGGFFLDDGR